MKPKILIADDLQFVRITIRDIIERQGWSVTGEAENGKSAVLMYGKIHPDILLLDITMPVMNGLTALKMLKEIYPDSKVIMCSALGQQKYIVKAIQLGASDFVVKPFKAERLISSIRKVLRSN
jgi:two-component system, chemotaxis family, chemotaxis protein CheY